MFLGVFAGFVILSEVGIARLLQDHRLHNLHRRGEGGLGGVNASGMLASGDEASGALLRDDLEVVGATGV